MRLKNRMAMLKEILAANPGGAFARYGLAMEYSNAGDFTTSLAEFATLLQNTPDYTPGYFMAAQTLVKASRVDDAKKMLANMSAVRRCSSRKYWRYQPT